MVYIVGIFTFFFTYLSILFCFHKWRREGLFLWSVLAIIIANTQAIKVIELFGLTTTLGNIVYISSFFVTNTICEFYGKKEAEKVIFISIFVNIVYLVFRWLTMITPQIPEHLYIQESLIIVSNITNYLVSFSVVIYFITQKIDLYLYDIMGKKNYSLWQKHLWSVCISQLIDSILFMSIYSYIIPIYSDIPNILEIVSTTFLVKIIINICSIPFIYLLRKMRNSHLKGI